ncbi:LON peptidase substrate-binding domain-containing protein [Herbiconiux sp. CPCC 203407]|uniref:LON peptidase substrate-binding domain-containing protein n=1 Tax=Herbiconiux oxytropis TaxID=2970915 RepID=A0AA42BW89_9MICO|nr:LON peptidase substrate-binding domain-containing protein [Herbiconiux oxytropis]MCS5723610.1 LON peptidase substrate-binding domain-containing protein [Herbiconiux oxytropis]MCS5727684.1 LON peptidase substrate-binding domain-containing protein [Herbiconiux oxytropis]
MAASPMFPLGSVLFPCVPIPLRVFEPRYLTMVGRLLDEDEPGFEFGVVLIERGPEAGGGDQRASVGTMARLVSATAGADDLIIVGVGTRRFTVERWVGEDPYPRAELSPLPDLEWSEALAPLRAQAEAVVRRVTARVAERQPDAALELSDDPVAAVWQLAAIAPLGEYDRYTLLRSTSMAGLLRQMIDLVLEAEELWAAP